MALTVVSASLVMWNAIRFNRKFCVQNTTMLVYKSPK